MGLFSTKQKGYLGVDLGTSSIKIVQLENVSGRPKLTTYGLAEIPGNVIKNDSAKSQARVAKTIKAIMEQSRTTSTQVVSAIPSYAVFSSIISLPFMQDKELTSAVRWEAKKFVPMPIEEMILDWKVLNAEDAQSGKKKDKKGSKKQVKKNDSGKEKKEDAEDDEQQKKRKKNLEILLTAAPKNIVRRYLNIFKLAELQLMSLETEAFSLERALIGNDRSVIILVDIGALSTDINIIADRIPILSRSIDVGGDTITRAIAKNFNVSAKRAEQFKRDFGMSESQGNQVPKTIEFVAGSVINEIKHVFSLYSSQGGAPIEKIILAGGSSFLPNLPQYLSSTLNINVVIGDPWSRILYPEELEPALREIGPRYAVSVGLALRHIIP